MIKTYPRIWEQIDCTTSRRKVPKGWIIWSSMTEEAESMCFVPDPKHEWILVPEPSSIDE